MGMSTAGHVRKGYWVRCDKCGNLEVASEPMHNNRESAAKKFFLKGWWFDFSEETWACPECHSEAENEPL